MENIVQPLVVAYFPADFSWSEEGSIIKPLRLMQELNGWGEGGRVVRPSLGGYIWLCFYKEGITEPEIQLKKIDKIKPNELKEIMDLLKSVQDNNIHTK